MADQYENVEATVAELLSKLQETERKVAEIVAEKEESDKEARQVREQLQRVDEERQLCKREVEDLAREYEKLQLSSELDKLRALDSQRQEHQRQLAEERAQMERERQRTDAWIGDLTEKNQCEKHFLEEKIYRLETELRELKMAEQQGLMDDDHDGSQAMAMEGVRVSSARDSACGEEEHPFRHSHQRHAEDEVSDENNQSLYREPEEGNSGQEGDREDPSEFGAEAIASAGGQLTLNSQPQHCLPQRTNMPQTRASHQSDEPLVRGQTQASHQSEEPLVRGQTQSSEPDLSHPRTTASLTEAHPQDSEPLLGAQSQFGQSCFPQTRDVASLIKVHPQSTLSSAGGQTPCSQAQQKDLR